MLVGASFMGALFVIVTVPVIAVGAGSARPILYVRRGRPSCLPLFVYLNVGTRRALSEYGADHELLFFGTEYTERTEYHGFYFRTKSSGTSVFCAVRASKILYPSEKSIN